MNLFPVRITGIPYWSSVRAEEDTQARPHKFDRSVYPRRIAWTIDTVQCAGQVRFEFAEQPPFQNTKRKANCMKRGVVNVEVYRPKVLGSLDSDGWAVRTL